MSDVLRDSWKTPRLWIFDANICFFVPLVVFHPRLWTICLFFGFATAVTISEMVFGYGLTEGLRSLRAIALGRNRPARPVIRRRRLLDYQAPSETDFF